MTGTIHCPICGSKNAHMINTWIVGSTSISCNGEDSYPDISITKIFRLPTTRGSVVITMFNTEQCDHVWLKVMYFHKGDVYYYNESVEQKKLDDIGYDKFRWNMWRD